MGDFEFLQNKLNGKWVVSAPRRSHRTNVDKAEPVCPFCPGNEVEEEELHRVSEVSKEGKVSNVSKRKSPSDTFGTSLSFDTSSWKVRVVKNKFPFAPHHEVIIHSPDHHKNFDELPVSQVELILGTYRQRFNAHKSEGHVYIFNNSGSSSGASLSHPHSQLVVIPQNVKLDITPLDPSIYRHSGKRSASRISNVSDPGHGQDDVETKDILETDHFFIFCPVTSEWPDEVWVAPKQNGGGFGLIKDPQIKDLSFVLSRLIQIFDLRHGHEFPYNFYISPLKNWYLRLIPRAKTIGGFELGTNMIVNTGNPAETFEFISEHFWEADHEKITAHHLADYRKSV